MTHALATPTYRTDKNGLGTASLVLGILSVLLVFTLIFIPGAWVLGGLGLILGIVGLRRVKRGTANNRGVAVTGVITSGLAVFLGVLFVVGFGVKVPASSITKASPGAASTTAQAPTRPAGPLTTFGEGTYEVGVDAVAGRYKTKGVDNGIGCYWERSKDDTGELASIKANDNFNGPASVTLRKGEFFKATGDCVWVKA